MVNPIAAIRRNYQRKENKKLRDQEVLAILKQEIDKIFTPHDHTERDRFIGLLKEKGLGADAFRTLVIEVGKGYNGFTKWEKKVLRSHLKGQDVNTLGDVLPVTPLSKVLVTLRELYVSDIAMDIPYDETVRMVVDHLLYRPLK
jgi:hypothetical protein